MAGAAELDNGNLRLTLGVTDQGAPCITKAAWAASGETVFENARAGASESDPWRIVDHPPFKRAEAGQDLGGGLVLVRVVDLAPEGSLFRLQVRMDNTGTDSKTIPWYPAWAANWTTAAPPETVEWWEALSFRPLTRELTADKVSLGSRLHSSDTRHSDGVNPYWMVKAGDTRLYFALEWCGGWEAELAREDGALFFAARLPEDETQLDLGPKQEITGPGVVVTVLDEPDPIRGRARWMAQREWLKRNLYGGPPPAYPFTYNHWYTTRFGLDGDFLRRQVELMDPYDFDFFLIDAGWYKEVGNWTPDRDKFKRGEFESILKASRGKGVPVGIWTCPQFITADPDDLPPQVDRPGYYEKFIDGHLLDMAGMDYASFLVEHVRALRERYGISWWKYDQLLFTGKTRHGVMRNVAAFQNALYRVRLEFPGLYIENCQSGGRMLNEFTVPATQSQWIRDGGRTGPGHAREILSQALGAVQFLPPWCVNRWTNNPGRNDPNDDEFTRAYCRSAMVGTWGLVADLGEIPGGQRAVILRETANYRRLNELKKEYMYDVLYPEDGAPAAGIVYYRLAGYRAAVLLLRWDAQGPFTQHVEFPWLRESPTYRVENADTGEVVRAEGAQLCENGFDVRFGAGQLSALLFLDAEGIEIER